MLRVENLCCARGPRELFRGLSFAAGPGEWVRITGANGSGKTTLLRALAGLTRPESGTIGWNDAGPLAESRAYVGHAPGFKDTLTVAENLALGWALDGEPAADAREIVSALARAGLEHQRHLAVARLSQGQKKRLHLARLTRSTRRLWLLDEPTAALDDQGVGLFADVVSDHLRRGGIAVVATHLPLPIAGGASRDVAINR